MMLLLHTLTVRGSDVTSLVEFRLVIKEEIVWWTDRSAHNFKTHKYTVIPADGQMFLREVPYEVIPLIFLWSSLTLQLLFLSICQPHNTFYNPTMTE